MNCLTPGQFTTAKQLTKRAVAFRAIAPFGIIPLAFFDLGVEALRGFSSTRAGAVPTAQRDSRYKRRFPVMSGQ
jgi:hypothetical protein